MAYATAIQTERAETPAAWTEIEFEPRTPAVDCAAHVAAALARALPEAVTRKRLTVVANGPSARGAPLSNEDVPTLALNGAIKLFIDAGREPSFWAACDPQALVADFLGVAPPRGTTYLVASKCDPLVFDRLEGRAVKVWHLPDYPAPGKLHQALCCSVTLSALWLMRAMGFTDFDVWGWDACYGGDRAHHGGAAETWIDPERIDLRYGAVMRDGTAIGGRDYLTTPAWAAEAQAAEQFFQLARYFDMRVTIHGDGMIKAVQESML